MAQPTAYVFRSAEDTLTFCYDAACESRNGDTWEIPEVIEYQHLLCHRHDRHVRQVRVSDLHRPFSFRHLQRENDDQYVLRLLIFDDPRLVPF